MMTAENGEKAVGILTITAPDLVLLDISPPCRPASLARPLGCSESRRRRVDSQTSAGCWTHSVRW